MKKAIKIIFVSLLLAGTASLHSCKKCVECEFVEEHDGHSHENHEEKCGNKKEIEKFEADMAAEAAEHGTTVNCHKAH